MTDNRFTRRNCPVSAQFVKDFRDIFGDDVQVIAVHENGVHIGAPLPPANGADNLMEEG